MERKRDRHRKIQREGDRHTETNSKTCRKIDKGRETCSERERERERNAKRKTKMWTSLPPPSAPPPPPLFFFFFYFRLGRLSVAEWISLFHSARPRSGSQTIDCSYRFCDGSFFDLLPSLPMCCFPSQQPYNSVPFVRSCSDGQQQASQGNKHGR